MNSYEYQKLRGLKRKLHLIDLRGGCCEKCGYNKNLSGFDFHHKDPSKKESQLDIRKLSNSAMEWILDEFDKCMVLCANCHREEHSPDLELNNVRLLVETLSEKINTVKTVNKPKCIDCNIDINYGHERCVPCNNKNRRKVEWPDLEILQEELNTNGVTWCSKKYGVARRTIKRWLAKREQ